MKLGQSRTRLVVLTVLIFAIGVFAQSFVVKAADVVGIDGGIQNANYYKEYVFLSGTPVLLTGSVTTATTKKKTGQSVKLSYTLKNSDGTSILKRSLSYDVVEDTNTDELSNIKCTETVTLDGTTYTLAKQGGYQLSKAGTISKNLAIDFRMSDWTGIKTYNVTGDKIGTLTLQFQGNEASNENYWGAAHFQAIKYDINYVPDETAASSSTTGTTTGSSTTTGTNITTTTNTTNTTNAANTTTAKKTLLDKTWSGHVEVSASFQRIGNLTYESSPPVATAYVGTYTRTDLPEAKIVYKYDMPSSTTAAKRIKNTATINLRDNSTIKKYVAKNLKDVINKAGTSSIQRISSLGAIQSGTYFQPNLKITRGDFLKALVTICNTTSNQTGKASTVFQSSKKKDLFVDIGSKSPYYDIVKQAVDSNIIQGARGGYFRPDSPITKSEIVTMVIKALGLQDYPYVEGEQVRFRDEVRIVSGAKEYFYTLSKLGIIKADTKGNIYPADEVTRGEAATILDSLLKYLQKDIQRDYDSLVKFS